MKVIATKLGIYGSDRIREGKEFIVPDGEPIPSWAVPVEVYVAPEDTSDNPQTLSDLAPPAGKAKSAHAGKAKKAAVHEDSDDLTD
jgi:hypothetical protein